MDDFEKARDEAGQEHNDNWQTPYLTGVGKYRFIAGADWAYEWCQELHRMQMAGISTALMCNTEKSMKEQLIDKSNPYWTVPYGDVITAVKREIKLREENEILKGALTKLRKADFTHEETKEYARQILVQVGKMLGESDE